MKVRIIVLSVCVPIFLVGCGSPLVKPKITDSRTFDAAYDDVWRAVVQTFAERSLPVSTLEKESGFITTQSHIIDYGIFSETTLDAIAVHPNIAFGIWESPKLSVNAFISPEGSNTTRVKINTHIEAFEKNMMGKWYICYSMGVIEKDILDTIQSKLYIAPQKVSDVPSAQVDYQDRGTVIKVPNESEKRENQQVQIQQRKIVGYRAKKDPATGKYITYPVYEDEKK